jgi:Fic family protein
MEPHYREDRTGKLTELAESLIRKASALGEAMHPVTRAAMAELVRPMNSYYSNLIEGHDTHPIDIERALRDDLATNDKKKRDLQLEAKAHILLHRSVHERFQKVPKGEIPSDAAYLKKLHADFYEHLPDDFKQVVSKEGVVRTVVPGQFRDCDVEVGYHVAPSYEAVSEFMGRFGEVYDPEKPVNSSLVKRIVNIAAAHHQLVWVHPFLDGNGRVVRLFSDACFMYEGLDASGLWSISRGLARSKSDYQRMLAAADSARQGDHDGRGNLSNAALVDFCTYFLQTAIDQIEFMHRSLQLDGILDRLSAYVDRAVGKGKLRSEARYVLHEVFLRGSMTKPDAERLMGLSDKTAKLVTDKLTDLRLLKAQKEGKMLRYYASYPISISPWILPNLYPDAKEAEMMVI